MISKYLETVLMAILFFILACAPTQYSFNVGNSHLSVVDPLIWLGGLLICISAGARILFSKTPGKSFMKRLVSFLKEVLPLPENILFVLLISLSFFKSESITDSAKELFQIVEYVIVAFILFSKIRLSDKTLSRTAVLFLSLVSIVVLFAVFQYFNRSIGLMDVKGTFGNRNTYGGFLAVTLPMILSIVLQIRDWRMKIWGLVILSIAGLTVLSGGASVGLLFAGSLICAFASRRAFLIWASIIAIAGILFLPLLPRNNMEVLKQSIGLFDDNGQVKPRYTEWQASLQMWREQPLLGVGLGNYQSQIGMNYGFLPVKEGPKEHDHNNLFLVFASTTGILGLIGLLTMLLFWFERTASAFFPCKPGLNSVHSSHHQILALGAMGTIVAFCITSIWTAMLVRGVFLLFVIIVATTISLNRQWMESNE